MALFAVSESGSCGNEAAIPFTSGTVSETGSDMEDDNCKRDMSRINGHGLADGSIKLMLIMSQPLS